MSRVLINISLGDPIKHIETGRIGILRDIKLTPNGINSPGLVAILFVEMSAENGKPIMSATSIKFCAIDDLYYPEFYPSLHVNNLSDKIDI